MKNIGNIIFRSRSVAGSMVRRSLSEVVKKLKADLSVLYALTMPE